MKDEGNQLSFEDNLEQTPQTEWVGMPEYNNQFLPGPEITATFKFQTQEDYDDFHSKVKKYLYDDQRVFDGMQKKTEKTAWYPLLEKGSKYLYVHEEESGLPNVPRFPVYIVSKGRWERNPTSRALMNMGVPFYMIVEESEYDNYKKLVGEECLLILPQKYKDEYDTFWDDDDPRTGPGPARNFAWDHSMQNGYDWHWVLDDNIEHFHRFNNNLKIICTNGTPFYICEDFVLRYSNIGQSGLNYSIFCPAREGRPPYKLNTRIYSCLLIRNDTGYRWRGRYNEDTDLSLRMMKDGWCTVQFNAFLQAKRATQTVKGGNSVEFYDEEGTLNKSKMLEEMHPDVAKVAWKFGRWHHDVNYKPFADMKLRKKPNLFISPDINNYGLKRINV